MNITKKKLSDSGKAGAEKRWEPIRTRKLEIIQELYLYHDKALVDWMTEKWDIEKLEQFLKAVKQKYGPTNK